MSKIPTLFLGFTLVVLAAALALLWQAFGPRPSPSAAVASRPPLARTPLSAEGPGGEPGVRTILPGPRPGGARAPEAVPAAQAARTPAAPPPPAAPAPEPAPGPSAALVPPAPETAPDLAPDLAPERAPGSAGEGVDLNTAPLEQLNGLGAGMIGRTIIAGRPYAAPDDLIARRILNRRDFETIRPRVTVR